MDPIANPFAPGAGTPPPELAGRDELRERVRVALERIRIARPAKSVLMVGLRGVGKTVLLVRMRKEAKASRLQTLYVEAPESRSLPALLAPRLREALLELSWNDKARDLARRALRGLAGFASALKAEYQDIRVSFDFDPEPGLADNGDLQQDLTALLLAAGAAAKKAGTALVLFVDELQYVAKDELAALITALHRRRAGGGTGHPGGRRASTVKSTVGTSEVLCRTIVRLPHNWASASRGSPARDPKARAGSGCESHGRSLPRDFLRKLADMPISCKSGVNTLGDAASESPIGLDDVKRASLLAKTALDEGFFRVRVDGRPPSEMKYLRAMADLGAGPHRSGDIARVLGKEVTALAPVRNKLIKKGMVWSPRHGETAFTVPLFEDFMIRFMPEDDWRT